MLCLCVWYIQAGDGGMGWHDVRDVAHAHILAGTVEGANGRYHTLLCTVPCLTLHSIIPCCVQYRTLLCTVPYLPCTIPYLALHSTVPCWHRGRRKRSAHTLHITQCHTTQCHRPRHVSRSNARATTHVPRSMCPRSMCPRSNSHAWGTA